MSQQTAKPMPHARVISLEERAKRQVNDAIDGQFNYFTRRGILLTSLGHMIDVSRQIRKLVRTSDGWPVRILDVGCAHGLFAKQIKRKFGDKVEVHALDVKSWKEWARPEGVKFQVGYAENLNAIYPMRYFDFAISSYAICYSADQLVSLSRIQEVTSPYGLIVVHLNNNALDSQNGITVKELSEDLKGRVTHFPPIKWHPIYSLQFKNSLAEPILQ